MMKVSNVSFTNQNLELSTLTKFKTLYQAQTLLHVSRKSLKIAQAEKIKCKNNEWCIS